MPPIPLDFSELPCMPIRRRSRTRLCFGGESSETQFTSVDLAWFSLPGEKESSIELGLELRQESSTKRPLETDLDTPVIKRRRTGDFLISSLPTGSVTPEAAPSPLSSIIRAVERLSTESDLVADGSRDNILPTIPGKHSDLNAISHETMTDVLNGVYDSSLTNVTIVDCRYPYEFEGGHIKGAINLYTKDSIQQFIRETVTSPAENHVLIFHCEFSSERGPKMYRHLRSLDRELNKDFYPRLNFPEVYLLEGGYKEFFQSHTELCHPQTYKPMLHKEHGNDLRHFRVKSKSWAAGDKPRHRSRLGNGVKLSF